MLFYSFGLSSATTLYLTAIIVGLIASKAFEKSKWFYFASGYYTLLFIITAIIIFLASEHIRNKNVETQKSWIVENMTGLKGRILNMSKKEQVGVGLYSGLLAFGLWDWFC